MKERIVLITGGNKGLGYETAKRLKELGYKVYMGARNLELGIEAARTLGVSYLQLDVTDEKSIKNAADKILSHEGHLDILINNAGITGPFKKAADLTGEDAKVVFDTNVFGPVRIINAFIPLLEKSKHPVIVNVSSGLGSFALVHDENRAESKVPATLYCASKSALTMLTIQYARALPNMRINAADPGPTSTDLNAHQGTQTVTEGTDAIVHLATLPPDGPTGIFMDRKGIVPW